MKWASTVVYSLSNLMKTTSIYKFGLSVCLSPINVKTAEPIWPKFVVRPWVTLGKVNNWLNFQICASNKIWFLKFWKSTKFFLLNLRIFRFSFYNVFKAWLIKKSKAKISQIEWNRFMYFTRAEFNLLDQKL